MCGRYVIAPPDSVILDMIREINRSRLASLFVQAGKTPVQEAGEILPSTVVPVLAVNRSGDKRVFPMKWGFTLKSRPSENSTDTKTSEQPRRTMLINARIETAAERPLFREAWQKHRCIVPASWYCEWEHDKKKQPIQKYAIRPEKNGRVWLAGLYRMEEGMPVFVILTRQADRSLEWMHDRMPLMLPEGEIDRWINPATKPEELLGHCLTKMQWERTG